jgi:hypothetical protein
LSGHSVTPVSHNLLQIAKLVRAIMMTKVQHGFTGNIADTGWCGGVSGDNVGVETFRCHVGIK